MKTIKGLLLGAAAALSMGSVASAADLPASEPVEYVKICDAFGAGYFFIPGTDTCLRISGYVRFQAFVSPDNDSTAGTASGGLWEGDARQLRATGNDFNDRFDMWTRALLRFDARSNTEWGVLRSFIEIAASGDNGASTNVRYAFIQVGIGGGVLTAGITDSFLNFTDTIYGYAFALPGIADPATRKNVLAYTASFGNGITATISLEESQADGGGGGSTTLLLPGNTTAETAQFGDISRLGVELPDLVGQIRVAQAWGSAQLGALVSQNKFRDTSCNLPGIGSTVCDYDEIGFAVRGGIRINLDMLSRGSAITFSAAYAENAAWALGYIGSGNASYLQSSFVDGVSSNGTLLGTSGFSASAGFQYFFTPALRGMIYGGYAELDIDGSAANLNGTLTYVDRAYGIGANLQWTPVRNLDLGVDVFYVNARQTTWTGAGGVGTTSDRDVDGWGAIFRIQRNF